MSEHEDPLFLLRRDAVYIIAGLWWLLLYLSVTYIQLLNRNHRCTLFTRCYPTALA